jgi:hypothetical protein
MTTWEVVGTIAAITFGAVGAGIAVTKLIWDRRDRAAAAEREEAEAAVRAHELERLRRDQEERLRRDAAARAESEFRVYSEAQAREFLRDLPTSVGSAPPPPSGARTRQGLVAVAVLTSLVVVALLVVWLASR